MPEASWPRCCSACRPSAVCAAASEVPKMPKSAHSSWNLSSSWERLGVSTAGLYLGTAPDAIKDNPLRRFGHFGQRDRRRIDRGLLCQTGAETRWQMGFDRLGHLANQGKSGAALDHRRDRLGPEIGIEQEGRAHRGPGAEHPEARAQD